MPSNAIVHCNVSFYRASSAGVPSRIKRSADSIRPPRTVWAQCRRDGPTECPARSAQNPQNRLNPPGRAQQPRRRPRPSQRPYSPVPLSLIFAAAARMSHHERKAPRSTIGAGAATTICDDSCLCSPSSPFRLGRNQHSNRPRRLSYRWRCRQRHTEIFSDIFKRLGRSPQR